MLAGYELLGYHGSHSAVSKGEGLEYGISRGFQVSNLR